MEMMRIHTFVEFIRENPLYLRYDSEMRPVINENYIVYTDNTNDENGNLNVFAAIYYPHDNSKLDSIETDEEWNEIDKRLNIYDHTVNI